MDILHTENQVGLVFIQEIRESSRAHRVGVHVSKVYINAFTDGPAYIDVYAWFINPEVSESTVQEVCEVHPRPLS